MGDRKPPDFGMAIGTVNAVCRRCAALVEANDPARALHRRWHEDLDRIVAMVEYDAELAREREERGDG